MKTTQILVADSGSIEQGAALIRAGELVAFPTETVYGLGANALDETAVAKIFTAKGRPTADPLIVHIADLNELDGLVSGMDDTALSLAERFWPGPLTLVLPKTDRVPDLVTSGLGSVAVRFPSHAVALALIKAAGVPIAAPSANLFGHTSPTTARHVAADLGGRIAMILDGGPTTVGVESTVVQVIEGVARVLRVGGVSRESIEEVIGEVRVLTHDRAPEAGLPSPGMLAKHYSPWAELIYMTGENSREELMRVATNIDENELVGILWTGEIPVGLASNVLVAWLGQSDDLAGVARNIYSALRTLDEQGAKRIYCHDFPEEGLGAAIRDRLRRASTKVV